MDFIRNIMSADYWTDDRIAAGIQAVLLVVVGFPFVYILATVAGRASVKRFSPQTGMLLRKGILYFGFAFIVITVLLELGFELTPLLGAAGVVGIAVGFASQTSVSNLISGIFLISEKPFAVGDVIKVGETMGIIMSIDLLSLKLRTFDNRFVRIPNETLIKTEVINITRFPIRRLDINLGVAYKEDVARVKDVLADIARRNPYCLDEPEPLVLFLNFGDSALEFLFGVWFVKEDFLELRNTIMQDIKERFDAEGIEIPFPHRTVYAGSVTDPFPVRVVGDSVPQEPSASEESSN
jgi:small-conductance mechanosensitive channel